jgi:hypothetical protein
MNAWVSLVESICFHGVLLCSWNFIRRRGNTPGMPSATRTFDPSNAVVGRALLRTLACGIGLSRRLIMLWGSTPGFLRLRSNPHYLVPGFLFKRITENHFFAFLKFLVDLVER